MLCPNGSRIVDRVCACLERHRIPPDAEWASRPLFSGDGFRGRQCLCAGRELRDPSAAAAGRNPKPSFGVGRPLPKHRVISLAVEPADRASRCRNPPLEVLFVVNHAHKLSERVRPGKYVTVNASVNAAVTEAEFCVWKPASSVIQLLTGAAASSGPRRLPCRANGRRRRPRRE